MSHGLKQADIVFAKALFDVLGDSEGQSTDEIRASLQEDGVDVDSVMERLMRKVKECSQESRLLQLDVAKQRRLESEAGRTALSQRFNEIKRWTMDEVLERIRQLAAPDELNAAFSFRELRSRSEGDLRSLLEDLELAKWKASREK